VRIGIEDNGFVEILVGLGPHDHTVTEERFHREILPVED
jgi:hypothetical protein